MSDFPPQGNFAQAVIAGGSSTAVVPSGVIHVNVTPQAMPIQRGEEFVPGKIIVGAHYALWAVVSLIVLVMGV